MNKMQFDFSIFSNGIFRLFGILATLLLSYNCNTTEPPNPPNNTPKSIKINLIDVSCTEAFIKIIAADTVLPVNIILKKDNAALFNFTLTKTDTVVIDTTLQPNITYVYQTTTQLNGKEENSDTIQVKTLNTTSHNFTWQTFTFGGIGGSSVLNDVAIINENNIWAVGEIYADTTGLPYNAVHWDGSSWELKKITINFRGNNITPYLSGVFAFTSSQIWLVGGLAIYGDGNNWTPFDVRKLTGYDSLSFTKCWGNNYNDMYYSGRNGSLAHYQNGTWNKIESGTTTNINDIWGIHDTVENNSLVLCTVTSRYHIGDYQLLSISGNTAYEYFNWPYTRLHGVWFNSPQNIYIVGAGAFVYKNNSLKTINLTSNYFLTRVKGNALNDIYISTSDAQIFHYNGINWMQMTEGIYGKYEGMDVKGDMVVFVGYNIEGGIVGKAVVTIGKHY